VKGTVGSGWADRHSCFFFFSIPILDHLVGTREHWAKKSTGVLTLVFFFVYISIVYLHWEVCEFLFISS